MTETTVTFTCGCEATVNVVQSSACPPPAAAPDDLSPEVEECLLHVNPRGDDANSGLTPRSAKASIGGALAGGATKIQIGAGVIAEPEPLTIPARTVIVGAGKRLTTIRVEHGGDFASLGGECYLEGVTIDGSNSAPGGRGLVIAGAAGRQELLNVAVLNFDGACIDFATQAGSQFRAVNVDVYRRASASASDRYAIDVSSDDAPTGAVPRSFINLQTQGGCAINFGGCDNFYVANSTLGDLRFSDNSRAVNITGSRLLNQMALTVRGHGNSVVACDINAQVTIAPGADNITIGPGAYNRLPVIDDAGNARNNVTHWLTDYAPQLTTGGSPASLGNGSLVGTYSRSGAAIQGEVTLTIGSTTALGTGELRISLPIQRSNSRPATVGQALLTTSAGTRALVAQATAPGHLRLWDSASCVQVTSAQPVPLPPGAIIRLSFTYHI